MPNLQLGDLRSALRDLDQAVVLEPDSVADILRDRAEVKRSLGDAAGASQDEMRADSLDDAAR